MKFPKSASGLAAPALALAVCTSVGVTGCNSKTAPSPENYTTTLNTFFVEHPDCLLDGSIKFPLETGDPVLTRQMDALVIAQMVEAQKAPMLHITRYTLTDSGIRAGKNFCFGHRQITSIDASTKPAPANHFTETQVDYHYKIVDMAVWAKTPQVIAAFPKMAQEASGTSAGKATLALTGVGWSVPD